MIEKNFITYLEKCSSHHGMSLELLRDDRSNGSGHAHMRFLSDLGYAFMYNTLQ